MYHDTTTPSSSPIPDETLPITAFEEGTIQQLEAKYRRTRHWPHTNEEDHLYRVELPHGDGYHLAAKAEERDGTVEVSVFQYDPMPDYDAEPAARAAFDGDDLDPADETDIEPLLQDALLEAD